MPNKQSLIASHLGSAEMLKWANTTHAVSKTLVHVKKETDGTIAVRCCMESNPLDVFDGFGASKKEATADALSQRFPS
jgi:hypothetical protein